LGSKLGKTSDLSNINLDNESFVSLWIEDLSLLEENPSLNKNREGIRSELKGWKIKKLVIPQFERYDALRLTVKSRELN